MKMNPSRRRGPALALAVVAAVAATVAIAAAHPAPAQAQGRWIAGDLNTHTYLTDGKSSQSEILANAMPTAPFGYGLTYLANAEPGGQSKTNSEGLKFLTPVWRWETLALYSYPRVVQARADYPGHLFIQGLQWDTSTHGQVSVGIVGAANEPQGVADFEYMFDKLDTDTSRAGESIPEVLDTTQPSPYPTSIPAQPMDKENVTAQNTLDGAASLENDYPDESYALVDHPSRDLNWTVGDLRALQDAAPDVVSGFEGFPGDQAAAARGGYGGYFDASGKSVSGPSDPAYSEAETNLARTYGGADAMVAKVGGVWDALLGEGRPWYVYGDSEFKWWTTQYKDVGGNVVGASFSDFWPGQYDKTWTYARSSGYPGLVSAIKSGDSFIVNGDLVNALDFHATLGKTTKTMGQTLTVKKGQKIVVTIRFRSPATNNNGDRVKVNHVDLIGGAITGRIAASSPAYATADTNATAHVVKTFGKAQMHTIKGWSVMTVAFVPKASMYFRLRGTNLAANTANQTDSAGNPLSDTLTYQTVANPDPTKTGTVTINTPAQAWADLWFYGNPIFVHVK
jgi:hypothetical protein